MLSQFRLMFSLVLLLMLAATAQAQTAAAPSLINFQGRLARPDGTPVTDNNYTIRFSLWTAASGGSEKWNQTISSVAVKNGAFAVLLNLTSGFTSGNDLRTALNGNTYLEIKIGTNAALTPRQQIVSTAYALRANSVPDGAIGTDQLLNGGVTSAKIADGTITSADLESSLLSSSTWLLSGNNISNPATQFLGTTSNQPLVFRTNNAEKMRLLTNGNLGIGTTSPVARLHLVTSAIDALQMDSSSTIGTWLNIFNSSSGGKVWNLISTGSGNGEGAGNLLLRNGTNSVVAMTLSGANGNVGVGTVAPIQRLDVNGRIHVNDGVIQRGGAAITSTSDLGLYSQHAGNWMRFVTNGAPFHWFSDGGAGTNSLMSLSASGELSAKVVIITGGSDVAEPYNVAPAGEVKAIPGYVVAIDADKVGQMRVTSRAYDSTVAGIVSGANGINPGITLRQKGTVADGELPVASIGRVWCWCDADASGPIVAGDLLTTSDTPGHAMKAVDKEKRDGAVIGKAMSSLKSGRGLVLVLVSLK